MTRDDDVVQTASTAEAFDADWYLATYPDVALSGLSAQEHYRKFGIILGRAMNAFQHAARRHSASLPAGAPVAPAAPMAPMAATAPAAPASPMQPRAAAARFSAGPAAPMAELALPGAGAESPINPAPADYAAPVGQIADPVRPGGAAPLAITAGGRDIARLQDPGQFDRIVAPLAAYCRMFSPDKSPDKSPDNALAVFDFRGQDGLVEQAAARFTAQLQQVADPGGVALQSGRARIANAWYVNETGLRFFLAEGEEDDPQTPAMGALAALRVFQAPPEHPEALQLVGLQSLADQGLGFFDAALLNPYMPILLELSDEAGRTVEIGLLAFPSLLRGGVHAAEQAALQLGAEPMSDIWRLSRLLLAELCPAAGCPAALSIAGLEMDTSQATGAERLMSDPMRDWLRAVFGLQLQPHETAPPLDPGARHVFDTLARNRSRTPPSPGAGLVLELPAVTVPSLSALCARRLDIAGQSRVAGPFLVADAVSCRPQWSVAMPLLGSNLNTMARCLPRLRAMDDDPDETAGARRSQNAPGAGRAAHWLAPLHLAVRLVPAIAPRDIQILQPRAPDTPAVPMPGPGSAEAFSLALQISDPARGERFLQSLAAQRQGGQVAQIQLWHDGATDPEALVETASGLFAEAELVPRRGRMDLDVISDTMAGDAVLLADDSAILYDTQSLAVLNALLAADAQAASVSCVLLHEMVQKGRRKLQVATGGIFPAAVSFASAPRLGIAEPDCLAALPETSYPVLANSFRLCLIRKSALVDTAAARAGRPVGGASADLAFGLDAFAAGYRSLCTSQVRAGTTAAPTRRDEIDPFGLACLLPARWDDLLGAVTVLRELRG